MKCRYCGKKGVSLSHFPKKHGALLARRSAAARRKGPKASSRRKRSYEAAPLVYPTDPRAGPHYCPVCGRPH